VEAFKRARRRATVVGVLFVELAGADANVDAEVVSCVADLLAAHARPGDVVARHGVGQFCILTVQASPDAVRGLVDRLCGSLEGRLTRSGRDGAAIRAVLAAVCGVPGLRRCTYERLLAELDEAIAVSRRTLAPAFVSLVGEEDASTLREVESRLFSRFLRDRSILSEEEAEGVAALTQPLPYCIGRLARDLGWIGPRRLLRVLREQRRTQEMFGEAAVRLGCLRPEQVYALLALQREDPAATMRRLVEDGVVRDSEAQGRLDEYAKFLGVGGRLASRRWKARRVGT
jgi:GGDEF domain-containing protein